MLAIVRRKNERNSTKGQTRSQCRRETRARGCCTALRAAGTRSSARRTPLQLMTGARPGGGGPLPRADSPLRSTHAPAAQRGATRRRSAARSEQTSDAHSHRPVSTGSSSRTRGSPACSRASTRCAASPSGRSSSSRRASQTTGSSTTRGSTSTRRTSASSSGCMWCGFLTLSGASLCLATRAPPTCTTGCARPSPSRLAAASPHLARRRLEREARMHEDDIDYLAKRRPFEWASLSWGETEEPDGGGTA